MVDYFSRIPEAAVFKHVDGLRYARIPHSIDSAKRAVVENFEAPRMVRFDERSFVQGGEAFVWFARMGHAVAQTVNVPYAVYTRTEQPQKDHGYLQHGHGTQGPFRTERVRIKNEGADRWLAFFEGKWRRVHIQVNRTFIVFRGERVTIQIEGV